jgi:hypothetical protein
MARKPAKRVEFTLFDVVYEDGSLRSNRRVPSDVLGGLDGDAAARAVIEEQVWVPKTSSVLIARPNRLNVSGDDCTALLLPDPVRLAAQVKEPT